jgi:hypothetical protein
MTEAAATLFKEWSGYLKPEDISQLQSAYHFSEQAHEGQYRKSGEPYISHPLAVASILAQWHLDSQALTAALLHDVMEDTSVTKTEISRNFGRPVAELVDGVSKLDKIEFESHAEAQAENFRKMLLAMARDVRVILIKLADRLHNMRTLGAVGDEKRRRIARETLDIYAPIANRLGLNAIYQELQDLALQHLYPDRHRVLSKAVKSARGNRRELVGKVLDAIKRKFKAAGLEAEALGREKHLYSIYSKMREKHLTFAQVLDVFGFRIIVADVSACYLALGALHGLYKPIPGKFKDYIAIPKANGYQSLHTTLFGPFGTPIEVQVRTREMHKIAEAGVASHWLYKDSDTSLSQLQKKTHQWLQSLLEMQSQSGDSVEFLEHLKVDLFPDEVYVFTPKGMILSLPRGATAVDFAYSVHTDIGNRCVAVKINQELLPLRTELKNGDRAVAQFRGERQGALAHPALPEDHALPGVGKARRAAARPGAGGARRGRRGDPRAAVGQARARCRPEVTAGTPYRHRARQAPCRRGGAAPARARRAGPARAAASRLGHHPRLGGHGRAVRPLLPADPGRPDHRHHQQGPGHGDPYPRLSGRQPGAPRSRAHARRGVGRRDAQAVRGQHQDGGGRSARRARQGGGRDCGSRLQYPERGGGPGRRQRLHQHVLHAAGIEPPAPRAHHARSAAHPGSGADFAR